MAEKDNIEFAQEQIAALNARDLDSYLSRIDESYTGESEMGGSVRGREGVRQYLETILRAFPDLKLEIEEIVASGDTVVTQFQMTATHRGAYAGIAATNKSIVADNAKLLQQLGVLALPKATAAG
jgi:predicted ester cyclase